MGVENHRCGGVALKYIEYEFAVPIFIGDIDLLKFFKSAGPDGHFMPFIFFELGKKTVGVPGNKGYNKS